MTKVAGPSPEEACPHCVGYGVFGIAPLDDYRYFGGLVDEKQGIRHDPCKHNVGCPILSRCVECGGQKPIMDYICNDCRS